MLPMPGINVKNVATWVYKAALISRFRIPLPDTSSLCETTDIGLVDHVVCLFRMFTGSNKRQVVQQGLRPVVDLWSSKSTTNHSNGV